VAAERERPSADPARVFAPENVRLRYTSDSGPGIRREPTNDGFRYRDRDGHLIRDAAEIARIRHIAIPPAWEDVWIAPVANGHLQATGRDARGRKQYRYHPEFRRQRDEAKYTRMIEFGRALPRIRKRVERDLARRSLDRERVLATLVSLLERTFMRVGNQQYARENRSYGLTTLRTRHVDVDGSEIRFHFRGKSGQFHDVGVRDRRLARIVRQIQDLPGQELFQYRDENGELRDVESEDVNRYLREAARVGVTAKDFRTWAGTLLAFRVLRESRSSSGPAARRAVRESTEAVAEVLGNTPTVSRTSYIAPRVVDAYLAGDLPEALTRASEASDRLQPGAERREELALIHLLETNAAALAPTRRAARPPARRTGPKPSSTKRTRSSKSTSST
jgi:DNA topoisomerase-1